MPFGWGMAGKEDVSQMQVIPGAPQRLAFKSTHKGRSGLLNPEHLARHSQVIPNKENGERTAPRRRRCFRYKCFIEELEWD